jgi:hypothetical protein
MSKAVDILSWSLFILALLALGGHLAVHGQNYLNDIVPAIDRLKGAFGL